MDWYFPEVVLHQVFPHPSIIVPTRTAAGKGVSNTLLTAEAIKTC